MGDFITSYLSYAKITPEVPMNFTRWAAIVGLGAYLGRDFYFSHGNLKVNPNIYAQFIGVAGTRKGTAIKLIKKLLTKANYDTFASERTSKEKFLIDLAGDGEQKTAGDLMDENLFGTASTGEYRQMFIAIDEFNDFIGQGNVEFISMLGNMWDYEGTYTQRNKTSKSVDIPNPTISILGGNTPTNFALAFPPHIVGQGFLSRMLIIHGETTHVRVAFPPAPDDRETAVLIDFLAAIKQNCIGPAVLMDDAYTALEEIYKTFEHLPDARFESYTQRRFTHLIKLCVICSASRCSREIHLEDVIRANTFLTHLELFMPKALGEFGKARNSDVAHKLYAYICSAGHICKLDELWAQVSKDLESIQAMGQILQNLQRAEKILAVHDVGGFLPNHKPVELKASRYVDPSFLTEEELSMKV